MLPVFLLPLQLVMGGGKAFPDPQREWRMCGMPRPAFVCDPQFVLPRADAEKLDQIALEFRKSTSCLCPPCDSGVSIGIFIGHNVSAEEFPSGKSLAESLRKRWALSPCGGDIVLVLLIQQNTSSFSLGPAVSKILPESTAARIVSECRVHFESGWYYQGLESVANSLNDVLVRLQQRPPSRPVFKNLVLGIGLGFGVLFALALAALLLVQRQNRRRKKSHCSDIYEGMATVNNRRKPSYNQAKHLEKLKRLNGSEEEDYEEEDTQFVYKPRSSSVHFARMNRQLSDVLEDPSEDIEVFQRYGSSSPKGNIPVTEL